MNQTSSKKLELIAIDGSLLDYVILKQENNLVKTQGGCFFPEGNYLMNLNKVKSLIRLKAKLKYNGKIFETKISDYKETPKWLKGLYNLFNNHKSYSQK